MKRKYPQDSDTIVVIKAWLTQNNISYTWKTKRKPELVEIMHAGIKAVKKLQQKHSDLDSDDLPQIKVIKDPKGNFVAQILNAIPKKDTVRDNNKTLQQVQNIDKVQKPASLTIKSQNKRSIGNKPANEQIKLFLDLKPNEWLLRLIVPTQAVYSNNLVLDTVSGDLYEVDDNKRKSNNEQTKTQQSNHQQDCEDSQQLTNSKQTNKSNQFMLGKAYKVNADAITAYHEQTQKKISTPKAVDQQPVATKVEAKASQRNIPQYIKYVEMIGSVVLFIIAYLLYLLYD